MSFDVVRDMPLFQKMFSDTNIGYEDLRDILLRAEIDKIKKEKLKEFVIKLLAIDEDSELAFKVGIKDSGIYSWWRYAMEII